MTDYLTLDTKLSKRTAYGSELFCTFNVLVERLRTTVKFKGGDLGNSHMYEHILISELYCRQHGRQDVN